MKNICIFLLLSACSLLASTAKAQMQSTPVVYSAPGATDSSLPSASTINVQAPGWMWNQMVPCDDPSSPGGVMRAGGPDSYGIYSFTGTGVEIHGLRATSIQAGGQVHRTGKLKVSIDGHVTNTVTVAAPDGNDVIFVQTGLAAGVHVLQMEPEYGWAAIAYLKLVSAIPATPNVTIAPPVKGHTAVMDYLTNYSMVYAKSDHWDIDTKNAVYMNGVPSRAIRSADDREYLVYRCEGLCSFDVRIYTKCSLDVLSQTVQFSVSADNGITTVPVDFAVVTSYVGGTSGDWFGYELAPAHALPAGAKDLIIVFKPETGNSWDPQLAQVALNIR